LSKLNDVVDADVQIDAIKIRGIDKAMTYGLPLCRVVTFELFEL